MTDPEKPYDDKAQFRALQKQFAEFVRPFDAIRKINAASTQALDQLEQAIKHLPTAETAARAAEDLRKRVDIYARRVRQNRREAFGRIESDFINRQRQAGTTIRETGDGWRVGRLELHIQREQARARALYNHEEVINWNPIAAVEDLENLAQRACAALDRASIPEQILIEVFWAAYRQLRSQKARGARKDSAAVPLPDFYREVRVALIRHELQSGRPDKKLTSSEMPRWAFLYNLDRYTSLGTAVTSDRRLGLQTGSQAEQAKGLGMTTNGLDPSQEYKAYCYIVPASGTLL